MSFRPRRFPPYSANTFARLTISPVLAASIMARITGKAWISSAPLVSGELALKDVIKDLQ